MTHTNMNRLEGLTPEFREKVGALLTELACKGVFVCVVSGLRTIQQQNQLYQQGRSLKGSIVTNAKGGQSPHNFGCAVDLCPLDVNGKLNWNNLDGFQVIGHEAKRLGLKWGGDFKSILDLPHVESSNWKDIQAAWKAGKIQVA